MKEKGFSWWLWVLIVGGAGFVLIQLLPFGKGITNPPVINEPQWDSTATAAMVKSSCYDCHSNEIQLPWYSKVAPASWLLQHDVDEGRAFLNFSEWPTDPDLQKFKINQIEQVLRAGKMPPIRYTLIHRDSKLSPDQINLLLSSLKASIK